jgi:ribose 5-phosphate isomerase RpiB
MKIYLTHDHYEEKHLNEVIDEMKTSGSPIIKVTIIDEDEEIYQAIEGCHRLRAAEILNMIPEIIILNDDMTIEDAEIGFDGCAETVGDISNIDGVCIEF